MSPPTHGDPHTDVVLLGYEQQENLGLRSIAAYLASRGFGVELVALDEESPESILGRLRLARPRVIGLSIIFQYSIEEFAELSSFLRASGVAAHLTAGGHFPSLRPRQTLELLPALDTVVRFEGEATLAELVAAADRPECWPAIRGLAFRSGGGVVLTEPRPLFTSLDELPLVVRGPARPGPLGVGTASMLASRGCLYHCAFCSIRQFYGGAPGAARRVRSAGSVADEMAGLLDERGVRYFSFQDDDFACRTASQRRWLGEFLAALDTRGLSSRIRWKISCRVDDVEAELLGDMTRRGLMAVYLGVESGNEEGLGALGKQTTVAQNLRAISVLKAAGVAVAAGFMLFDPSSRIDTIRQNIDFLATVGSDGYFPLNFCKMLPYAGTPIEASLMAEGRLVGTPARPDYRFLDPRLNGLEILVQKIFSRRNFGEAGLVSFLQQADLDLRMEQAFGDVEISDRRQALGKATRDSNLAAVRTLSSLVDVITTQGMDAALADTAALVEIAEREWRAEASAEISVRKHCFKHVERRTR